MGQTEYIVDITRRSITEIAEELLKYKDCFIVHLVIYEDQEYNSYHCQMVYSL